MPGQCGRHFFNATTVTMERSAMPAADGFSVPPACHNAISFGTKGPGSLPGSLRPSNSTIWPEKMMTAMPAVKPTVTG